MPIFARTLNVRTVDAFINKKISRFKKVLPGYRNARLLAGVGALVVKDEVERYAEDAGLYVLTQTSEGGATIANSKEFPPKVLA